MLERNPSRPSSGRRSCARPVARPWAPTLRGVLAALLLVGPGPFAARAQPGLGLSPSERASALASGRVSEAVVGALARGERPRVLIAFAAPDAPDAPARARGLAPEREAALRARGDAILERVGGSDLALHHRYRALPGLAGSVTPRGLLALLDAPGVLRVDLDDGGRGHLAEALPLANVSDVQAGGLGGSGVTVAVLDSGVDATHPDIGAAAVVGEQCFCRGGGGCCPGGGATQSGAGAAADDHGHGTNVTGIVTSDGAAAPRGAAPDASIVAIKVLDASNGFCCSSDVIAGLDWILASRPDVDAVNMSLGTFATYTGDCDGANAGTLLYAAAIDALHQNGVLSFVASLNGGSTTHMSAPACIANAVSVGAVWDAAVGSQTVLGCTDAPTSPDLITCWSNRNTATDLFAPGAPIASTGLGGGVSVFFGTSQATPMVAGCAALLLESAPALPAAILEAALETSATQVTDPVTALSYPRLDCAAALASVGPRIVPVAPWVAPAVIGGLLLAALAVRRRALR